CTTMDTLDYSGTGLNEGSKVVMAAVGPAKRTLPTVLPGQLRLPAGFENPQVVMPGVMAVSGPRYTSPQRDDRAVEQFCADLSPDEAINRFPLIVVADDSQFVAESLRNFLWVTFTRSDPAADIYGVGSFVSNKHWGCRGSLVIDA